MSGNPWGPGLTRQNGVFDTPHKKPRAMPGLSFYARFNVGTFLYVRNYTRALLLGVGPKALDFNQPPLKSNRFEQRLLTRVVGRKRLGTVMQKITQKTLSSSTANSSTENERNETEKCELRVLINSLEAGPVSDLPVLFDEKDSRKRVGALVARRARLKDKS